MNILTMNNMSIKTFLGVGGGMHVEVPGQGSNPHHSIYQDTAVTMPDP